MVTSLKLIICLDNKNGASFSNKRQSSDQEVIKKIITLLNGEKLYVNRYTQLMLSKYPINCVVCNDPLNEAPENAFVMLENNVRSIRDMDNIEVVKTVFAFRWNRVYPSDVKLNIGEAFKNLKIKGVLSFKGHSHDKIDLEVYEEYA